jgi:hypothetical protein
MNPMARLLIGLVLTGVSLFEIPLRADENSVGSPEAVLISPAAVPVALTIVSGEHLVLLLETGLNSASTKAGDPIRLKTNEDLRIGNSVAIPQGTDVNGTVTRVQRPGRIRGKAVIQLRFNDLCLADGRLLSMKLCLIGNSSGLLKTRLKHGIELRKSRGDAAGNGSPSTLLQR